MENTITKIQGWIITALLVFIFIAQAFSIFNTYQQDQINRQRASTYEERVEKAQQVLDRQRDVIFDLITDYENAAYFDPNVDRITEQQLLAAEFQLTALQSIAIQNTQIIELLAASPLEAYAE